MVGHLGPFGLQEPEEVEGRRFPGIRHIPFVGHSQEEDPCSLQRLPFFVQGIGDLAQDIPRHPGVDLAGQLDEPGMVVQGLQLPGQVLGIDRHTVASQARARIEGHEAEWLRSGRQVVQRSRSRLETSKMRIAASNASLYTSHSS